MAPIQPSDDYSELSGEQLIKHFRAISGEMVNRGFISAGVGFIAVNSISQEEQPNSDVFVSEAPKFESLSFDTIESITGQFQDSYVGYQATLLGLNYGREKNDQIEAANQLTVDDEFKEWFTSDVFDQVVARQEVNPGVRFTLVATPNLEATLRQLVMATKTFSQAQPEEPQLFTELYEMYGPSDFSSTNTNPKSGKAVNFSLVEDRFDPRLRGTATEQWDRLQELQTRFPHLQVPSVLEAITYWNTLRSHGVKLTKDKSTFNKTYIRHFDLEPKVVGGHKFIPSTDVNLGRAALWSSHPEQTYEGRVSLGESLDIALNIAA